MTPFILVLLPLSAALVAAFFRKFSAQLTAQIGFIVISLYGITNALFTILFVGPYRTHTYTHFVHPWFKHLIHVNPLLMRHFGASVTTTSGLHEASTQQSVK